MDIYIANLHVSIVESDLKILFKPFGQVLNTTIVKDMETGVSRGFGFVKMDSAIDAQRAIDDLNGRTVSGKPLHVSEAIPKDSARPSQRPGDENSIRETPTTPTKRTYDGKYVSVKFDSKPAPTEDIPIEVIDEAEFSTTVGKDGFVNVSFKREEE